MAEFSQFWNTNGTGDGLVGGYTRDDWIEFYQTLFIPELQATVGVLPRSGNKCAVTGTANNNIQVATGRAIIYGFLYKNTSALAVPALAIPIVGTTGFRIVLRAGWTAQTVRVAVLMSADGVASIPALTQVAGTTWEVSLATGTITTGNVVTLTDTRAYAKYNTLIGGDQFDSTVVDNSTLELAASTLRVKDSGITAAKIAAAVAGNGLAGGAGTALSVNVDGVTLEINADALRVKDDGIDDLKVGNRVAQFYRYQSGDATHYDVAGATTRTPTTIRVQWGCIQTNAGGNATVTFPVAFSARPWIGACVLGTGAFKANPYTISASQMGIETYDVAAHGPAGPAVAMWLAIGAQ